MAAVWQFQNPITDSFAGFSPRSVQLMNSRARSMPKLSTSAAIFSGDPLISDGSTKFVSKAAYTTTNEVQTITQTGGTVTAGTWTFTFDGQTVTAIPYNVTATALSALFDNQFGTGNIVATGGPLPGTGMVITYKEKYGFANQPLAVLGSGGLTGGTFAIAETTAGSRGAVTSTTLWGFSGEQDRSVSAYSSMVMQYPPNYDEAGNVELITYPAVVDFWASASLDATVAAAQSLVGTQAGIGVRASSRPGQPEFFVDPSGSNKLLYIRGIAAGDLNKLGGNVEFEVITAKSTATSY